MPIPTQIRRFAVPRAAVAVFALLAAACGDRGSPLSTVDPPSAAPRAPTLLASLDCTASVRAGTVVCGRGALPSRARGYIVVGGQGQYVQLTSTAGVYNAGTHVLSFDVTVQNLIPQPMNTVDGATAHGEGVRVIFHSGPTLTGGAGAVSVLNADSAATFTASNQKFFRYRGNLLGGDGILGQNETSSAKTWQISVDAGVTTFTFQLYVVAEVPHAQGYVDVTPPADTLAQGGTAALTATVRTAVGNPVAGQTITWESSNATVATVNASGQVTAVAPGSVTITATAGARSGSATLQVCPGMGAGGVYVGFSGSFCLAGVTGQAKTEYTVTPVNLGLSDLAFSLTAAGIVGVDGPPTPIRLPGLRGARPGAGLAPDDALHLRMLREQRETITRLRRAAPAGGVSRLRGAITPGTPAVGALMTLNVALNACSSPVLRTGRVRSVGTRIIIIEDTLNPSGGFTQANYEEIAETFDTLVYPAVTAGFGTPGDTDGNNGRVIAFYTTAVNAMTPPSSSSYVGGLFQSRDLLPAAICPGSNLGEMFYMLAPDPDGTINGNERGVEFVRSVTIGTLGHEFQHLINASHRIGDNFDLESVWLNEALSHVAEELVFYQASGFTPGQNLSASSFTDPSDLDDFFEFMDANFGRFRQWLLRPDTSGAFKDGVSATLASRGAGWSFLRYAADRKGGSQPALWNAFVATADTGVTNLSNRLGTDPRLWMRDWAAATYMDEVAGVTPFYTQPSWNFRSMYGVLDYDPGPVCSCAFELHTRHPANGVAHAFTLSRNGGAGYLRMAVPQNAFAGVTTNTAPSSSFAVVVMRTK